MLGGGETRVREGRAVGVGEAAAGAATGGEHVVADLCSAAARPGPGRARAVGEATAGAATSSELVVVVGRGSGQVRLSPRRSHGARSHHV